MYDAMTVPRVQLKIQLLVKVSEILLSVYNHVVNLSPNPELAEIFNLRTERKKTYLRIERVVLLMGI